MPSKSLPDADLNLPEMNTKSPSCPAGGVHMYVSMILTEICIFSKIFKQMQVLQKQKDICIFSARALHSVKCWYILYCTTELFLTKQKDHQVYLFSKI